MRNVFIGVGAIVVGLGTWMLWPQDAATYLPYKDAAAVARGALLYEENCASCHGDTLEGEPNWRQRKPDGKLPAPPHDPSGHTWHHPSQQLFQITKFGTEAMVGQGYKSDMPGFEEMMSDVEIREVLAFIKSTWPKEILTRHDEMSQAN